MLLVGIIKRIKDNEIREAKLTKQELPFTITMILLDLAAPIFLMIGLTMTRYVVIKGFCSGTGSLLIAFYLGEKTIAVSYILIALLLGFVAYGLSIFFYIYAQRDLGASRTSA